MNETVSIAMCTYNGEKYLKEQLDSISAQTKLPDELVICDDASSDDTLKIIESFLVTSQFDVKVIKNIKNSGLVSNFEQAISNCSGDIIFLSDQDDFWSPDKIRKTYEALQCNPTCGYVFTNAEIVNKYNEGLGKDLWSTVGFTGKRRKKYENGKQIEVMLRGGNFIYGMTMAFRSKYRGLLLPIESKSFGCTHDTWISILLSLIGLHGICIPEKLTNYRQHDEQVAGAGKVISSAKFVKSITSSKSDEELLLADALQNIYDRVINNDMSNNNVSYDAGLLLGKIKHLRSRASSESAQGIKKWKIVMLESLSGRYGTHSSGWKSILRDLIVNSKVQ